jgi:hypothetical protein
MTIAVLERLEEALSSLLNLKDAQQLLELASEQFALYNDHLHGQDLPKDVIRVSLLLDNFRATLENEQNEAQNAVSWAIKSLENPIPSKRKEKPAVTPSNESANTQPKPDRIADSIEMLTQQVGHLTEGLTEIRLTTQQQADNITRLVAIVDRQTQMFERLFDQRQP